MMSCSRATRSGRSRAQRSRWQEPFSTARLRAPFVSRPGSAFPEGSPMMKRSIRTLAFGLGCALVLHARLAAADLDIRPVQPGFQAAAGSSVLVEAVIENDSDDVVFLNSISADLTDEFAGADLFDEFNASAPDSL